MQILKKFIYDQIEKIHILSKIPDEIRQADSFSVSRLYLQPDAPALRLSLK